MAALFRSCSRIIGITRVLRSFSSKDRHTCLFTISSRHITTNQEQSVDTRNWQITNGRQHENFHLEYVRRSRSDSTSPKVWTKNLISTLRHVHSHQPRNASYEKLLAIVMDMKHKVAEETISPKLSAELGREVLDIIASSKHMSTLQKGNLTSLLWKIIQPLCDSELDESYYKSYLMACSESNIMISVPEIRQKMADSGLQSNTEFLQAALRYYCSIGDLVEGRKILNEMKNAGMTVNSHSFNSLVTAYAKTGLASADGMLEIMREHNINQDLVTYGAMLQFHATLGDMDAIEKTLQNFEDEDFEADDKIIAQLQIFLPLLQSNFREEANKAISSLYIPAMPPLKVNEAVDDCALDLLMNGFLEEAFQVYCKPPRRGRTFIHYFLLSEEAKKADSIIRGVKWSVRLLEESRIDLEKLFKDSALASIAFLTTLMKELKELEYVINSTQLNYVLANVHPCNWKTLVLMLADLDIPTLETRASEELARHINDPHYGSHTDCVKRILEQSLYQNEEAALYLYRKLVKEDSQDPRLPVIKSSGASHIQDMYLKLGHYTECQHYLREMIVLNPTYAGHLTKVLSSASVMLKNGCKEGVMETINYTLRHIDKISGSLYIPGMLPELLIQLVPPNQAFSCLEKINVHHKSEHNKGMIAKLMRLYMMGNDADLLAESYIVFLKTYRMPATKVKTSVVCQLMEEGREDLVQKVVNEMTILIGKRLTTVYHMVSLLLNGNIDGAKELHKKYPSCLKTVLSGTNEMIIPRLFLYLFNKPEVINALLDLVVESNDLDAEMYFENNLYAALQNSSVKSNPERVRPLLKFSSQNPNTSLGKQMKSVTVKLPYLKMLMKS